MEDYIGDERWQDFNQDGLQVRVPEVKDVSLVTDTHAALSNLKCTHRDRSHFEAIDSMSLSRNS